MKSEIVKLRDEIRWRGYSIKTVKSYTYCVKDFLEAGGGKRVEGPLDFSLTGILASISNALAEAKISIFAISTYDTDYILIQEDKLYEAVKVLSNFCNIQS